MKNLFIILFISIALFSCTKNCGECFVTEFETDGVTIKQETLMGEYCGSDAKVQAGEDANNQGITCTNCRIDCR